MIGSLVEKQLTTPQQYPLTLSSLVAACNQSSNREPVVSFPEHAVMEALNSLKAARLIRFVLPSHGRSVVRYRHILDETLALDTRQSAIVAVLLLRGPQTVGEIRLRTDRMTEFDGLEDVNLELAFLARHEETLASNVGRRPGQKEERWACPLRDWAGSEVGTGHPGMFDDGPVPSFADDGARAEQPAPFDARLLALQSELDDLRDTVEALRADLDALHASLGD